MCCFAKPVRVVSDTNIYSRLTGRGTQMLAYQMKYDSDELNAMILPIPIAKQAAEDSLRGIERQPMHNNIPLPPFLCLSVHRIGHFFKPSCVLETHKLRHGENSGGLTDNCSQ